MLSFAQITGQCLHRVRGELTENSENLLTTFLADLLDLLDRLTFPIRDLFHQRVFDGLIGEMKKTRFALLMIDNDLVQQRRKVESMLFGVLGTEDFLATCAERETRHFPAHAAQRTTGRHACALEMEFETSQQRESRKNSLLTIDE